MAFSPTHTGLIFTQAVIDAAQRDRTSEFRAPAFAYLTAPTPDDLSPDGAALLEAFRYRFLNDVEAGERGVQMMIQRGDAPIPDDSPYLDSLAAMFVQAHTFELLREHPAFSFLEKNRWQNTLQAKINALSSAPYQKKQVENLWLGVLVMAAAIITEDEESFNIAAQVARDVVDVDIRPQGYIVPAVEGGDGGMYRQVASAAALVMLAEMAAHAGVDLWNYEHRGVSIKTAAIYPIYYYYITDEWGWDQDLAVEDVQAIFKPFAGYLEIVKQRTGLRDLNPLLEDLRPIFSPYAGGLTTLSHGVTLKRRGLFG